MRRLGALFLAVALVAACQPRGGSDIPIANAVRANDVAGVRALLEDGQSVDAVGRDGHSLLYLATGPRGGLEVLALLLAEGADVEKGSADGRTPLMNAAGWCDLPMVALLLAHGADPAHRAPDGRTARDSACAAPQDRRQAVLDMLGPLP